MVQRGREELRDGVRSAFYQGEKGVSILKATSVLCLTDVVIYNNKKYVFRPCPLSGIELLKPLEFPK